MTEPAPQPLFILSFRQRDELADLAAGAGWRVVAARRSDALPRRVAASGAAVIVIDARGAVEEGLAAVRAIGNADAMEGRALIVLLSRKDTAALDDLYAAGATHFLLSPMRAPELLSALRFAARYAERVSGGWVGEVRESEPLGWRYDHKLRSLQLTPALARLFDIPEAPAPIVALRCLGSDRELLLSAIGRLRGGDTTAFAHDLPGIGRVVQHLQSDRRKGRIHAFVEPLGETPDASAVVRDLFKRRSRSLTALARELPQAIERGEIEVLFQPQVEISSGQIVGVEALARWQHPRLGEVGAQILIEAALRAGRGQTLSSHLVERTLSLVAGWPPSLEHLRVAINATAADLAEQGFVGHLLERIDASGVARGRITIELTEGELVEDLAAAAGLLRELRTAGCRVAIDDFGTGYSSLAYLNALPIDYLKIDKALAQAITGSERERVVVRGVIDMAHSLGLKVIAEGVETETQRDLLASDGCEFFQGFLCAPPVDSAQLATLV